MIETYLKKVNKEDLQSVTSLAGVSSERIPYLVYKQYRYAYITDEECFVSRETITYPQLEILLAKRKEGLVFTLEESDELIDFLNIPEEGPKEEVLPEEPEMEVEETQESVSPVSDESKNSETDLLFNTGTISTGAIINNEGVFVDGEAFSIEEPPMELENERVDVSPNQQQAKKKQTRKKKNQA